MPTITIKNKSKRMQVFNLPHEVVCEDKDGGCGCTRQVTGVQTHDRATGEKQVRALKRKLPSSITLMASGTEGDTLKGLAHGVAHAPEVAKARKAGLIEITVEAPAEKAAPKASAKLSQKPVAEAPAPVKE